MENYDLEKKQASIRLDDACKNNTPLFDKMFLKNPNFVPSRGVCATGHTSGISFETDSVGEMGEEFFGDDDLMGVRMRLQGAPQLREKKKNGTLSTSMMTMDL